jgi:hypothetical protein
MVVMISVGMSNTTQEFSAFVRLANADPAKSPTLVIVDGAQGGMDARAWAASGRPARPDSRNPWEVLDDRLKQAVVAAEQVQVAWVKQARIAPGNIGEFPKHAEEMQGHMVTILNMLKDQFPNLRIGRSTILSGSPRIWRATARIQVTVEGGRWPNCC